jgi:transcriptional regulator with XRE-family HTH domain
VARTTAHRKFGEWMKDTREALGMSQARFAKHVGRSQSFVAKTELGERRMDIVEFVQLADALGTSPAKLFQRVLERLHHR